MKKTIKIEFTEIELKHLIAEKFKLKNNDKLSIRVSHYAGDQREPGYTNVIVEGEEMDTNFEAYYKK